MLRSESKALVSARIRDLKAEFEGHKGRRPDMYERAVIRDMARLHVLGLINEEPWKPNTIEANAPRTAEFIGACMRIDKTLKEITSCQS